jgi:tyramine---L-glutamate ligase
MRVFIYEYITGGGLWPAAQMPSDCRSLLSQGAAMVRAITEDYALLPGIETVSTRDSRLPALHPPGCQVTLVASEAEHRTAIKQLATSSDWTLLIAPETGGELQRYAQFVELAGGRLLSPESRVVSIAADKQKTAELLGSRGVPVPRGVVASSLSAARQAELRSPLVMKPLDGCGSEGVRLIREPSDLEEYAFPGPLRLEEFVPGLAASVSVLCGPAGNATLPACRQILSSDGCFEYRGGCLPLEPALDRRAQALAARAVPCLGQVRGYIGVDLVLGSAVDGSEDAVIEINPRLTTSYIGLRATSRTNLASAMLTIAEGQAADLSFGNEPLEFAADGTIR